VFRPEFLNRVDEIIIFRHLEEEDLKLVVGLELAKVHERLGERGLELFLTDTATAFVVREGAKNLDFGARPLRRAIENKVEDPLSEDLLRGEFAGKDLILCRTHRVGKKRLLAFEPKSIGELTDEERRDVLESVLARLRQTLAKRSVPFEDVTRGTELIITDEAMDVLLDQWQGEGPGGETPLRQVVETLLIEPLNVQLRDDDYSDKDVVIVGATGGDSPELTIELTIYEQLDDDQRRRIVLTALNPLRQQVEEPKRLRHGMEAEVTELTLSDATVDWVIAQAHELKDDNGEDASDGRFGARAIRNVLENSLIKPLLKQRRTDDATKNAEEISVEVGGDGLEFKPSGNRETVAASSKAGD
jgi:ATP-dependent Clp protease ATP-binding subunit ClpA